MYTSEDQTRTVLLGDRDECFPYRDISWDVKSTPDKRVPPWSRRIGQLSAVALPSQDQGSKRCSSAKRSGVEHCVVVHQRESQGWHQAVSSKREDYMLGKSAHV